jgi:prevent-host-death family protein
MTNMRVRRAAQYNVAEAKARFAELVRRAMAGEEVVIAKDHKPVLRMVPIAPRTAARRPGSAKGKVWTAPDFDETPPEFEPYVR